MPNYYFREVWTPLKLVGVKLFVDDESRYWIKVLKRPRRRIN